MENLQAKIEKARKAGYTDTQIQTFLKTKGVNVPTTPSLASKIGDAAVKRGDTVVDAAKAIATSKDPVEAIARTAALPLRAVGQVAGFASDTLNDAVVEPVLKATGLDKPLAEIGQGIAKSSAGKAAAELYDAIPDELQKPLEDTAQIASLAPVGVGAQLGAKTAATTAGAALKGVGAVVEGTGKTVAGAGKVLNATAFTPTVREAERILNYRASTPFLSRAKAVLTGEEIKGAPRTKAQTALEQGIAGTESMVGVGAKRKADALWTKKIAPAVRSSNDVLTKEELFAPALKLIDGTVDPTRRTALQNAFDALQQDYAGATHWTLENAQALKRDIDKFTPTKLFRGQDVANEVRTLQHEMADAIREKTYTALKDVNIRKDYIDYANLIELENIGVKAISEAAFKGGSGTLVSGLWDMATTPIKTVGGQVLYKVGNAFTFVGQKGIKRAGEFLQSKGFRKPSK